MNKWSEEDTDNKKGHSSRNVGSYYSTVSQNWLIYAHYKSLFRQFSMKTSQSTVTRVSSHPAFFTGEPIQTKEKINMPHERQRVAAKQIYFLFTQIQ